MPLNPRSEKNLIGVHPDLVRVVRKANELMGDVDPGLEFIVTEGVRTITRQAELYKARATRTMNSRHLSGHAVDLAAVVGGEVRWDWPLYARLAGVMKTAAYREGVKIIWGGDWTTFKDGPHFELDRMSYPAPAARE